MNERRAGIQMDETVVAWAKRTPSRASRSMLGVLTCGWPAELKQSARCPSSVSISMFGSLAMSLNTSQVDERR